MIQVVLVADKVASEELRIIISKKNKRYYLGPFQSLSKFFMKLSFIKINRLRFVKI